MKTPSVLEVVRKARISGLLITVIANRGGAGLSLAGDGRGHGCRLCEFYKQCVAMDYPVLFKAGQDL
jgi:hypothetical protein